MKLRWVSVLIVNNVMVFAETDAHKTMLGAQYYDGKKMVVPLSEEAAEDLFEHWTSQALSSFMAAIAAERYSFFPDSRSFRLHQNPSQN
ncbi:unnamed protein product [Anisakis simplex]|uniref:Protease n=1 Tax=Anisakis simplex TaxID=6269 RepID=A0A0M3KDP9_ANISI|nr:unnamed protein product [Anisakis simplex]